MAFQQTSQLQIDKAQLSTLQYEKFIAGKDLNINFLVLNAQ